MINFNEISVSKGSSVFNEGNAGEVICTIAAKKKLPTDGDKLPDWKLFFYDDQKREINEGFYYIDPERFADKEKFNNKVNFEAATLKHVVNALHGKDTEYPPFQDTKQMLDWCMEMVAKAQGSKVKAGFTYGTTKRPKNYLSLKRTFPFITTNLDEAIKFNNNDLMERPTPTTTASEDTKGDDLPWNQ